MGIVPGWVRFLDRLYCLLGALPSNGGFDIRMPLEINGAKHAVPFDKTWNRSVPMENKRRVPDHPPSLIMTMS
jgi:hypothetical protein